jgi:L-fuculose-phosphate aldolase/L-ribulose-5-phosphate 4-epimerase
MNAGTGGNVSVCDPERKHIIITPTFYGYDVMKAEDIVVIDLKGNVVEGWLRPSSEWRMHAVIYQRVPRAGAVVHTHSPYATSFAALGKSIPVFLVEMVPFIKGSLDVSPYAPPGTEEVGIVAPPPYCRRRTPACWPATAQWPSAPRCRKPTSTWFTWRTSPRSIISPNVSASRWR